MFRITEKEMEVQTILSKRNFPYVYLRKVNVQVLQNWTRGLGVFLKVWG